MLADSNVLAKKVTHGHTLAPFQNPIPNPCYLTCFDVAWVPMILCKFFLSCESAMLFRAIKSVGMLSLVDLVYGISRLVTHSFNHRSYLLLIDHIHHTWLPCIAQNIKVFCERKLTDVAWVLLLTFLFVALTLVLDLDLLDFSCKMGKDWPIVDASSDSKFLLLTSGTSVLSWKITSIPPN